LGHLIIVPRNGHEKITQRRTTDDGLEYMVVRVNFTLHCHFQSRMHFQNMTSRF
jgi:hypothetical protein